MLWHISSATTNTIYRTSAWSKPNRLGFVTSHARTLPFLLLVSFQKKKKVEHLAKIGQATSLMEKKDSLDPPFWRVVLTHKLLRTPRTPTNSYELPTFTKVRTPKNNIFWGFLKLLLSCCYVVAKIQRCCCKQLGVRNNNLKYELQSLNIFKKYSTGWPKSKFFISNGSTAKTMHIIPYVSKVKIGLRGGSFMW